MSTSDNQPALAVRPTQQTPRTRLQPIGGSGKSVYVVLICLTLSIIGAVASRSYSKGTTAYISSNAPGASVRVDGGFGRANSSGAAEFIGLPFGTRSLAIEHGDSRAAFNKHELGLALGESVFLPPDTDPIDSDGQHDAGSGGRA